MKWHARLSFVVAVAAAMILVAAFFKGNLWLSIGDGVLLAGNALFVWMALGCRP